MLNRTHCKLNHENIQEMKERKQEFEREGERERERERVTHVAVKAPKYATHADARNTLPTTSTSCVSYAVTLSAHRTFSSPRDAWSLAALTRRACVSAIESSSSCFFFTDALNCGL